MKKRKLNLSDEQRNEALELATKIHKGEINQPTDLVDKWKPIPDKGLIWGEDLVKDDSKKLHVDTSKIIGTARQNINRFKKNRIIKILEMMYKLEYDYKPENPPDLILLGGRYYVNSDGNHRTLAHKALDIDEMYANVTRYVMKN